MNIKNTIIKHYKKFFDLHAKGIALDEDDHLNIDWAEDLVKNCFIPNVSKRFSSAEKMAEWLHNNYEEIALNNGWKTQEDCQVPFCDLPKENKQTMIEVCERFLNVC